MAGLCWRWAWQQSLQWACWLLVAHRQSPGKGFRNVRTGRELCWAVLNQKQADQTSRGCHWREQSTRKESTNSNSRTVGICTCASGAILILGFTLQDFHFVGDSSRMRRLDDQVGRKKPPEGLQTWGLHPKRQCAAPAQAAAFQRLVQCRKKTSQCQAPSEPLQASSGMVVGLLAGEACAPNLQAECRVLM